VNLEYPIRYERVLILEDSIQLLKVTKNKSFLYMYLTLTFPNSNIVLSAWHHTADLVTLIEA